MNPALRFGMERGLQSAGMVVGEAVFVHPSAMLPPTFLRDESRAPLLK